MLYSLDCFQYRPSVVSELGDAIRSRTGKSYAVLRPRLLYSVDGFQLRLRIDSEHGDAVRSQIGNASKCYALRAIENELCL